MKHSKKFELSYKKNDKYINTTRQKQKFELLLNVYNMLIKEHEWKMEGRKEYVFYLQAERQRIHWQRTSSFSVCSCVFCIFCLSVKLNVIGWKDQDSSTDNFPTFLLYQLLFRKTKAEHFASYSSCQVVRNHKKIILICKSLPKITVLETVPVFLLEGLKAATDIIIHIHLALLMSSKLLCL